MKVDFLERLDLSKGFGHVLKFEPVFFHRTVSVAVRDRAIIILIIFEIMAF
jgi:hypothetical protein